MENWNHRLFMLINAGSHPSTALLTMAMFLAQWLIYGIPLVLVWLWISGGRLERHAAVSAAFGVGLALLVGQIITAVWPHPRPFMIGLGQTLLAHKSEASFPSDHATVFFTLGIGIRFSGLRKLGTGLLLAGALVGWSRVFLGVHFPLDIVGALIVALPCAWFVWRAFQHQTGAQLITVLEKLYDLGYRRAIKR